MPRPHCLPWSILLHEAHLHVISVTLNTACGTTRSCSKTDSQRSQNFPTYACPYTAQSRALNQTSRPCIKTMSKSILASALSLVFSTLALANFSIHRRCFIVAFCFSGFQSSDNPSIQVFSHALRRLRRRSKVLAFFQLDKSLSIFRHNFLISNLFCSNSDGICSGICSAMASRGPESSIVSCRCCCCVFVFVFVMQCASVHIH